MVIKMVVEVDREKKVDEERFKVFRAIVGIGDKWSVSQIAGKTGLSNDLVYRHWVWLVKHGAFKGGKKK